MRNKARIIYKGTNYSFYINGDSDSTGCIYIKSTWTTDSDNVTVTSLNSGQVDITTVSAVPSDAVLLGNSDTLATLANNAPAAHKLVTARTFTIGSTGKSFDGTANVS